MSDGQLMLQSVTVTVKAHCTVLFEASVAVQVTVVVPTLKQLPDAGTQATVAPEQLSLTVGGVKLTFIQPEFVLTFMLAGQALNVGFWLSLTVTVKEQPAGLPAASLTEQVTVVMPFGKSEPEAGLHTTLPTPEQLSVAVGTV